MPVRTDLRRRTATRRSRLTGTRVLGIVLLGLGLIATTISLISVAAR